jgi:hypothetical protein
MKALFILVLGIFFTSCSGYFNEIADPRSKDPIYSLALADGSGFISTDDHNEITPFIFKDTNTGKKYLFFASDRGGDYDIYYAEMDNNGKFSQPAKMPVPISSSDNEFSPVVFYALDSAGLNKVLFISFCHGFPGGTNLETHQLDADFNSIFQTDPFGIGDNSRLSLIYDKDYPELVAANGDVMWTSYGWDYSAVNWTFPSPQYPGPDNSNPITSVSGFRTVDPNDYMETATWHILSVTADGRNQICVSGISNDYGSVSYKYFRVSPYVSAFNDKDPYVDIDDLKVYFSSDRYGKGNFDLYRYNDARYDRVFGKFMNRPELALDTTFPDPLQFSWQPVPGATHYKIYLQSEGFQEIADITGTTYIDSNAMNGNTYYYGVQALNGDGSSGMGTLFVNYGGGQIAAGQHFWTIRGR